MRDPIRLPFYLLASFGGLLAFIYACYFQPYSFGIGLIPQNELYVTSAGGDFRNFWAMGKLVVEGRPEAAYNAREVHKAARFDELNIKVRENGCFYPPILLPLLEPFGHFAFDEAYRLYIQASLAVLGLGMLLAFWRYPYAFALMFGFGAFWKALGYGQNSIILCGLYLMVLALLPRFEKWGGMALGLAAFKPHIGILAPLVLFWRGQWGAFFVAALVVLALMGGTTLLYGNTIWLSWIQALAIPAYRLMELNTAQLEKMAALFPNLLSVGTPFWLAAAAQGVTALMAVNMCWRICRRALDPQLPVAAMLTAALLISPHIYSYDLLLWFIPIMVLVRRAQKNGWEWGDVEAVLPAYLLPFFLDEINHFTMLPAAPVCGLLLLARLRHHSRMDHELA